MRAEEKRLLGIYSKLDKLHYKGKCLWDNCPNISILSHSHTKSLLSNIAVDNKVYGLNRSFISMQKGEFFKEYGIRVASTFHGFCSRHDNELFKYIENKELVNIDHEAAFLLFARTIFFEIYQKRVGLLRSKKLGEMLKKEALAYDEDLLKDLQQGRENYLIFSAPEYEKMIYSIANTKSYTNINFLYKKINKKLELSLSTNINPLFNDHHITTEAQPLFSLNIIPYQQYGLVVLVWPNKFEQNMKWIEEQFQSNFNKLVNFLCFIESEDWYFSKRLYYQTIKNNINFFKKALFNRVSHPDFGYEKTKIFFDFASN